MIRTGKIARLPREIRQQLNRRLADGERGERLLAWLNGLPEVRAVLAADFGGRAVSKQNLAEWRQGGHREWLAHQDLLAQAGALTERADEVRAVGPALTDQVAVLVTAQLGGLLLGAGAAPTAEDQRRLRLLRTLCGDLVELRRGDHSAARLRLEQERLEREREKTEAEIVAQFEQWARNPALRGQLFNEQITPEERRRRIREIFGLPPDDPASDPEPDAPEDAPPPESQTQSNPVKPLFRPETPNDPQ